jgi:hypothetical protein
MVWFLYQLKSMVKCKGGSNFDPTYWASTGTADGAGAGVGAAASAANTTRSACSCEASDSVSVIPGCRFGMVGEVLFSSLDFPLSEMLVLSSNALAEETQQISRRVIKGVLWRMVRCLYQLND